MRADGADGGDVRTHGGTDGGGGGEEERGATHERGVPPAEGGGAAAAAEEKGWPLGLNVDSDDDELRAEAKCGDAAREASVGRSEGEDRRVTSRKRPHELDARQQHAQGTRRRRKTTGSSVRDGAGDGVATEWRRAERRDAATRGMAARAAAMAHRRKRRAACRVNEYRGATALDKFLEYQ